MSSLSLKFVQSKKDLDSVKFKRVLSLHFLETPLFAASLFEPFRNSHSTLKSQGSRKILNTMPFHWSLCQFLPVRTRIFVFIPFVWERINLKSYLCCLKSPIHIKKRLKNNHGTQLKNNKNFSMPSTYVPLGSPTKWHWRWHFMLLLSIFLDFDFLMWCSHLLWWWILNISLSGCCPPILLLICILKCRARALQCA